MTECQTYMYTYICLVPPYAAFPLTPGVPPVFLSARPVANRMLSNSEATVRTPPTIAHVLSASRESLVKEKKVVRTM